jgi:hypothetical protein
MAIGFPAPSLVRFGSPGLDDIAGGGLPRDRPALACAGAVSGKLANLTKICARHLARPGDVEGIGVMASARAAAARRLALQAGDRIIAGFARHRAGP